MHEKKRLAYSVEAPEVPLVGKVLEGDGVGLVANGESDLDEEVHDHQATSTESIRSDLQCVGDDQTRPRDGVADVEEPDEGDLRVSELLDLSLSRGFEACGDNGPGQEENQHT